jgi:hypothetical protein
LDRINVESVLEFKLNFNTTGQPVSLSFVFPFVRPATVSAAAPLATCYAARASHANPPSSPTPASPSIRTADPFFAPFSATTKAPAAANVAAPSSPVTDHRVAPHSPPSSPSGARSRHGAARVHCIHRDAPRDKFRVFPSGCVSLSGSLSNPLLW